jgi:hypothetical protein
LFCAHWPVDREPVLPLSTLRAAFSAGNAATPLSSWTYHEQTGRSLRRCSRGATGRARCSWEKEPGEYRWFFDRADSGIRLRVLTFRDLSLESDDRGTVVFEASTPIREMVEAIADGAQNVLNKYGEDEYLRRSVEHPFPTGHLELIRAYLAE